MRGRSERREPRLDRTGGAPSARGESAARREPLLDRAARRAAGGLTRRDLMRVGAGAAAAVALPRAAWPTAAPAISARGLCPPVRRGVCPAGTEAVPWRRGAAQAIPSGVRATFNGCGAEGGFGGVDPITDMPGGVDFFYGCNEHDCCYGVCGADGGRLRRRGRGWSSSSSAPAEQNEALGLAAAQIVTDEGFALGRAFGAAGTPSAVLLGADGRAVSPVAVGADAVLALGGPLPTAAR